MSSTPSLNKGVPLLRLGVLDTVKFRYADGTNDFTYQLEFRSSLEFDDLARNNNEATDDNMLYYTILDGDTSSVNGYLRFFPKPKTTGRGTFYIRGYQTNPIINSIDDKVLVPIPSVLIDYLISQVERVRGNDAKAAYYEELFFGPPPDKKDRTRLTGIALLEQISQQKRRPEGQPRSLVRFAGHTAMRRLFGNNRVNRDYMKENYWD